MTHIQQPAGRFPTTQWSLVLAGKDSAAARRETLGRLFESYWQPLYFYTRRRGLSPTDAEDAIQGFWTSLWERNTIDLLDPMRGRLRAFLKSALRNYLANEHAYRTRFKRGGNTPALSLDFEVAESALSFVPDDPEKAYDRTWSTQIIERCMQRLTKEYESGTRSGPAPALQELFGFQSGSTHQEIADRFGMTLAQVKAFAHRARKRFRELLLEEVATTVDTPPMVVDEAKCLYELIG
ncbi:MAG: sigma-70 family RNA polymerase sigma factor [Kofleriaceae bacterium]|nr:sigma-70 family RNA polymerase sigma factor [Kofleriaceae bacterium]